MCVWDETGLEHFRGVREKRKEGVSVLQGRWQLPHPGGAGVSVLAGPRQTFPKDVPGWLADGFESPSLGSQMGQWPRDSFRAEQIGDP